MMYTDLQIRKTERNKFLISVETFKVQDVYRVRQASWASAFLTYEELEHVLSNCPERGVQRKGVSKSFAHRCRTTKYGNLCLSVRWDGGGSEFLASFCAARLRAASRKEAKDRLANVGHGKGHVSVNPIDIIWELSPFVFADPEHESSVIWKGSGNP